MKVRLCELCKEEAAVFCPADAAFLCGGCDARVHGANFLVARHVRRSLHATCRDPVTDEDEEDSVVVDTLSSSSSACNSSTTKKGITTTSSSCNYYSTSVNDREKKSQRALVNSSNVKGVFIDWCGRLGLGGGQDLAEVVRTACAALKVCTEHLPLRVGLAAALWLGLRLGRSSLLQTWKVAKRLEEVSGVPARVILAVGSKLERVARINGRHKRRDLEEGWAESS